jgi:hypothetical protein
MSGFYLLDVPEFRPLAQAAAKISRCKVHDVIAGYRFVEFDREITIRRSDTGLKEAVWFGCLTAGLDGKIAEFTSDEIRLVATNEPIIAQR